MHSCSVWLSQHLHSCSVKLSQHLHSCSVGLFPSLLFSVAVPKPSSCSVWLSPSLRFSVAVPFTPVQCGCPLHSCSVGLFPSLLYMSFQNGWRPLHLAIEGSHVDMVELLLVVQMEENLVSTLTLSKKSKQDQSDSKNKVCLVHQYLQAHWRPFCLLSLLQRVLCTEW